MAAYACAALWSHYVDDQPELRAVGANVGNDFIGGGIAGDRYVTNTHWHPDVNADHEGGPKFAFYLDAPDGESGALRVIPASHKPLYHDELRANLGMHMEKSGFNVTDLPAYICVSEPGDVVLFVIRTRHASWGGSRDRRMVSMTHYRNPKTDGGKAQLRPATQFALQNPEWMDNVH